LKAEKSIPKSAPLEDFLAVSGQFRGRFASSAPSSFVLLHQEDMDHENRF
jgi:hypothetical protein